MHAINSWSILQLVFLTEQEYDSGWAGHQLGSTGQFEASNAVTHYGSVSSALVFAAFAAVACDRGVAPTDTPPAPVATPEAPSYFTIDPATAGTVRGTVRYHGSKPRPVVLDMSAEAACVAKRAGQPAYDEQLVVGPAGGVANAFVYIKVGLEGKKFERPQQTVVLDQQGCVFTPRVVGLQAGGALAVRNSDPLDHNVHPGPRNNYEWNEGMAAGAPDAIHRFARHEVMIRVKCNVHPWMRAWIGVVEHPYFAVTGTDGSFELNNVPPGDYTIGVWHEQLGELAESTTIAPSATQSLSFTYDNAAGKGK